MVTSYRIYQKKKTYGYKERCEEKRQVYLDSLKDKNPEDLVYLDESGINDNETYPYAWGMKGPRIYAMKHAERHKRVSIIGALNQASIKAPFVFEGTCDSHIFELYLEQVLVPELKPGQTVIMDNASFHKGKRIAEIIQKAGCALLYLPAYSPDFNPIEHYWAPIKHHIRKLLPFCNHDLHQAVDHVFQYVLS